MAITLGEALVKLRAEDSQLDKAFDQGEKKAKGWVSKVGGLISGGLKAGLIGAGVGITGAAVGIGKAVMDAVPVKGMQAAFDGLAANAGKTGEEVMEELKRGSQRMISKGDLYQTYNSAAQLVSQAFAEQLPDAMGYLGKVAQATGEDMGFLLDSLVKGVGRLSPAILDNLAIQVNATEAYDAYAASIGVSADELTKQQQQTAMMNMVLEKLAENTAAMPEVMGSMTQIVAATKAEFTDAKDAIGLAFMPVVQELATLALPILSEALGKVGPIAENIAGWLGENLPTAISTASTFFGNLWTAIQWVFTGEGAEIDWWHEIVGVFGLSEEAGGKLADKLYALGVWLSETVPVVIEAARSAWSDVLLPALDAVWLFVQDSLVPALSVMGSWLLEQLPTAIEGLKTAWETVLLPAMTTVWSFVQTSLVPAFEQVATFISENLDSVLFGLKAVLITVVVPAFVAWAVAAGTAALATITALAPVLVPIAAIGAAAAALHLAWESDWLGIRTKVTTAWTDHIKPAFDTLATWLTTTLPEGAAALWLAIQEKWDAISTKVTEVKDALVERFGTIKTWLTETLPAGAQALWDAIKAKWDLISGKVSSSRDKLVGAFTSIKTWFTSLLPGALEAMKRGFYSKMDELNPRWRQDWEKVKAALKEKIDAARQKLSLALLLIRSKVNSFLTKVKDKWTAGWEKVRSVLQEKIDAIRTKIVAWALIVKAKIVTFLTQVKEKWDTIWTSIVTFVAGIGAKLITAARTALKPFVTFVRTKVQEVKRKFTDIDWGQVGRNIIDGIGNGIRNAAHSLGQRAANAARAALDAAKRALGISSPSKEFMKVGDAIMEGMEIGLKRRASRPVAEVEKTAKALTGVFSSISGMVKSGGSIASDLPDVYDALKRLYDKVDPAEKFVQVKLIPLLKQMHKVFKYQLPLLLDDTVTDSFKRWQDRLGSLASMIKSSVGIATDLLAAHDALKKLYAGVDRTEKFVQTLLIPLIRQMHKVFKYQLPLLLDDTVTASFKHWQQRLSSIAAMIASSTGIATDLLKAHDALKELYAGVDRTEKFVQTLLIPLIRQMHKVFKYQLPQLFDGSIDASMQHWQTRLSAIAGMITNSTAIATDLLAAHDALKKLYDGVDRTEKFVQTLLIPLVKQMHKVFKYQLPKLMDDSVTASFQQWRDRLASIAAMIKSVTGIATDLAAGREALAKIGDNLEEWTIILSDHLIPIIRMVHKAFKYELPKLLDQSVTDSFNSWRDRLASIAGSLQSVLDIVKNLGELAEAKLPKRHIANLLYKVRTVASGIVRMGKILGGLESAGATEEVAAMIAATLAHLAEAIQSTEGMPKIARTALTQLGRILANGMAQLHEIITGSLEGIEATLIDRTEPLALAAFNLGETIGAEINRGFASQLGELAAMVKEATTLGSTAFGAAQLAAQNASTTMETNHYWNLTNSFSTPTNAADVSDQIRALQLGVA